MTRRTLAELLSDRPLTAGEAVTVLVPVLQTLDDLHALDCTHGAVSAETVFFDDVGRATLAGWQHCVEHRQGDVLGKGFRAAMIADCRAFVELARVVVPGGVVPGGVVPGPVVSGGVVPDGVVPDGVVPGGLAAGGGGASLPLLAAELGRLERGRREPFVRECEAQLFELAPPEPVSLAAPVDSLEYDWGAETAGVLARITAEVDEVARADGEAARPVAKLRSWAGELVPSLRRGWAGAVSWPQLHRREGELLRRLQGQPRGWVHARTHGRVHGRTIVVGAVVCVAAVIGALAGLPSGASRDPAAGGPSAVTVGGGGLPGTAVSSRPAVTATPGNIDTRAVPDTPAVPDPPAVPAAPAMRDTSTIPTSPVSPVSPVPGGAPDEAALSGVDPVAAAAVLLDLRQKCLAARSLPCLERVDQPGSSARTADRAALTAGAAPAVPATPPRTLRLVQAVGASALIDVVAGGAQREPASLLLVKGEAGWRIRELLPAGP